MSRRFARPYAQALLASVSGNDTARQVRDELAAYAEAQRQISELHRMAANPAVPQDVKESLIGEVCGMLEIGAMAQSVLVLLMKNFRLPHLDDVVEAVDTSLNRRLGIVSAEVTSAQTLSEGQKARLEEVLGRALDQKVDLTTKKDPKLLGGFVARIGSYRYDASLEGQLGRLAGALAQDK